VQQPFGRRDKCALARRDEQSALDARRLRGGAERSRVLPRRRKLLLLGRTPEVDQAAAFLESDRIVNGHRSDFERAVLESFVVPAEGPTGQPLGELQIARRTGVRVLGIARDERRILVPQATEVLRPGDRLLGLGTLDQLRDFRSWLASNPQRA
jgi:hypothetical protein